MLGLTTFPVHWFLLGSAGISAGCPTCRPAATAPGHSLALAALATWLAAEALGAYMLRTWLVRAGRERHVAEGASLPFMLGHAGLAFTGFVCWISFVATHADVAAWLALGFMAPAIGFGVSTVTVWTPYPAPRPQDRPSLADLRDSNPGVIPDDLLARALADDGLARQVVDDLLASNIGTDQPEPWRPYLDPRPIIPLAHGVLAIVTFVLATMAAVAA